MRASRPGEAADIYKLKVEVDSDDTYARRLIQALYSAGRLESALALLRHFFLSIRSVLCSIDEHDAQRQREVGARA
jgi:hypothetical protein